MVAALAGAACLPAAVSASAMARPLSEGQVSRVQISAREFGFSLSRPAIRSGRAIVELVNFGEDPHDLRLRRVGGTRVYRIAEVGPGERAELALRTLPGRYVLWCSLGDHRRRGMVARLTVTR